MTTKDSNVPRDPDSPRPEVTEQGVTPFLPPEFESLDADTLNRVLAEQAALLAQPAANLDPMGAPHFLRNVAGEEVCGQDGQPWPCVSWRGIADRQTLTEGLSPEALLVPTMAEAAAAAGMDLAEFEAALRQTRGK